MFRRHLLLQLQPKWPFIHLGAYRLEPGEFAPVLVMLPDGRLGAVHHLKSDGNLGVRPIHPDGSFYPNTSAHWTDEQRAAIPEELALAYSALRPPTPAEVPGAFKDSQ